VTANAQEAAAPENATPENATPENATPENAAAENAGSEYAAGPVRTLRPQDAAELVEAAHTLAALGLVTAFGHVSARTEAGFVITPAADLAVIDQDALVAVPLAAAGLPPRAPAEAWAHLALYRARPDVRAVARAQPPAAIAAAAPGISLRPLHGQGAWLGRTLPVYGDARLLRSPELAAAAAATLPEGEAMLLRGNGAVTTGDSPGLAVARMWLVSAVCQAWTSARPQERRGLSEAEIDAWRAVAPELLPRLWNHLKRKAPLLTDLDVLTDLDGATGRSCKTAPR
jgi:HCOMODA/2-hydroxy-3-carboxy-muconic semialdehyde decarboxylase